VNVVFVTHAYPRWEGDVAGSFLERLVIALAARGVGVRIVAPADGGKGGRELRHHVPVLRVRYAPARWETLAYRGTMQTAVHSVPNFLAAGSLVLRQARAVAQTCAEQEADLVHAQWWVPGGVSAWLARRPYLVTLHGMDVVFIEHTPPVRPLARHVLERAAAVTAVSSDLADRLAQVLGLDRERIVVQPMPIEASGFSQTSRGGGGIVTVGRLMPRKRLDVLLNALVLLRSNGKPTSLTIIGDGPERSRLERLAAELGLGTAVRFLGQVPPAAIPQALGDADVFAFPALGEGFGLAAAEALMAGVPVVAAKDGGGVNDIIPETGAGRLVDARPEPLARALGDVLSDPDARRLAAAAGAALRHRLAPATVAENFEALYRRATAGGGSRA